MGVWPVENPKVLAIGLKVMGGIRSILGEEERHDFVGRGAKSIDRDGAIGLARRGLTEAGEATGICGKDGDGFWGQSAG